MNLGELVKNARGFRVGGVYRVSRFEVKTAKNGKAYGDLIISDQSFEVPAKYWDIPSDIALVIQQNFILQIEATLDYFKDAPQLTIEGVKVPERQIINDSLRQLGIMAERDINDMHSELISIIASIKSTELRQILEQLFVNDKDFAEKFSRHPGAVKNHHACIGGLLEHTLEVAQLAADYAARNSKLNRDLLLSAALVHDIGKVREIAIDAVGAPIGFTKEGKLLRHIYLGMEMVEAACRAASASEELRLLLKHCIYSHHGQAEWGSPVEPMVLEAEILHFLDNISAKAEQFAREEKKADPGGFNKSFTLRREIYRPNIE